MSLVFYRIVTAGFDFPSYFISLGIVIGYPTRTLRIVTQTRRLI